jgi:glycosyltransferase involved in cell wall biosynthesis
MLTYALITPTRNEAENLLRLAKSLANQTQLPRTWVIVDNGSDDGTVAIANILALDYEWICVIETGGEVRPRRGAPVVRAFHKGVAALGEHVDVVVKLDADVSLDPPYFARLLGEFESNPRLGMASGCEMRVVDGTWQRNFVTGNHVWGPARAYRSSCLPDVLPLEEALGWDAIDEIKARLAGWEARHIPDLTFRHHRAVGARDGGARGWIAHGLAAHYIGYRPSYVIARAIFRARRQIWAPAMHFGYL